MIHVYTGNGKGKTTAAIGQAVRALGHQKKVCLIQFLKTPNSGEINILKRQNNIDCFCFGKKGFCRKTAFTKKDYALAEKALLKARFVIDKKKPNMIILDELNLVLYYGLLEKKGVIGFIKSLPWKIEVIITGRRAPKEILRLADLVSEIKEVKHYYKKGVKSRKGIEY